MRTKFWLKIAGLTLLVGLVSQFCMWLPEYLRWKALVARETKILTNWGKDNPLVPLNTVDITTIMQFPISFDMPISAVQKQKLYLQVEAYLKAYGQSDYAGYKDYRFKYPYEIDTALLERMRQAFNSKRKISLPQAEPEQLLESLWRNLVATNHITDIAKTTVKLHVTEVLNINRLPNEDSLNLLLPGAAVIHKINVLKTSPTPAEIVASQRGVLVFVLQMFVKTTDSGAFNGDNRPMPCHVVFYWSDANQDWMPWDIGLLTAGKYVAFL